MRLEDSWHGIVGLGVGVWAAATVALVGWALAIEPLPGGEGLPLPLHALVLGYVPGGVAITVATRTRMKIRGAYGLDSLRAIATYFLPGIFLLGLAFLLQRLA